MIEEGRLYFNELISDLYVGSVSREGCLYIIQQSNIMKMDENDFKKLTLPDKAVGFYHEFNHNNMMGAYDPFLKVIKEMKEHIGMSDEELLRLSGACLHHYDIFKSYFATGVCKRKDWPILTELEYEKKRILQAIVKMLKVLSDRCLILVLLNNIQMISTSTIQLLELLVNESVNNLRIIGIMNQSAKSSHYTARAFSNLLAVCKERGSVSDWTILEEEEIAIDDQIFYIKQADEEEYFTKLNNMLMLLTYEQANNYLSYINQRFEADTVNVTEQFRARQLRYYIISRMYKGNYAMALLVCDTLRKTNCEEMKQTNQLFACYYGAICSLYNGNQEDAKRLLIECKNYIGKPDERQKFELEILDLMITLQGFAVSVAENDIPIEDELIQNCEKYGYENYLAHLYVYATGNKGDIFFSSDGVEARIPDVMKGIHIAEKLDNIQFIMRAYEKNVMKSSLHGFNLTSNYFYDKMIKVANSINDKVAQGSIYNGLGYNCCSIGDYKEANKYYNNALEIFCYHKDEDLLLETLYNIGMNDILGADYSTAIDTLMIINEFAQLMKKSELRLCNMSKIHGLIALAAARLGKYYIVRLYYNKMKRVLDFFIEGRDKVSDFYLWDNDLFFYYFIDAVIKMHERRNDEALELFKRARIYMEHSKGSFYFTFYQYTIELSKLYLRMDMHREREELFREAKSFFRAKNNMVCVNKLEELEKTGVWTEKPSILPFQNVSLKDVNKRIHSILIEKDTEQRMYEMHSLMTIQDVINYSYNSDGIRMKEIMDKFKHSFDIDQVLYLRKQDDIFIKEYSDFPLTLTKKDYKKIEKFFTNNTEGFITSQIANSFFYGEDILKMFRQMRIFSAIAVPIYNNDRLNSIFFAFNCVGDSYKVCMRKNRMNMTDLDTYRFIFRQVVEANEKYELNEQLKQQVYNAEKANRAKSDFLARMSHEIRTPINAVLGMDEMILRESTENEIKYYASDIKSSANNLLDIINEILDSAKIESGKMEIVCAKYHMSNILNNLYKMIYVKAEEKGLELIFDVDKNLPLEYYGDDLRIRQVLMNLLTNAVKYTPSGVVTLTVSTIKLENNKALLRFSVKDTGIGIKSQDIEKLFSEFERIDTAKNRYIEGTGLGINITVRLLHLMGSELHVQSVYGKGSTFYFYLEQEIINPEPIGDFRERENVSIEPDECTSYTAPDAKILVVDDNSMNRKVFKGLLKPTQMKIIEAGSGEECLKLLNQNKFDIIFLDHMMPKMDGLETFKIMKENKLCENVPVIMLTANAIIGMREEYLAFGLDDFLTKPIKVDLLDKIILKYLPKDMIKNGLPKVKEKDSEENTKDMPEIEGFDFDYAMRMMGNSELLQSTLKDFFYSLDDTIQKFNKLEKDLMTDSGLDNYRIEVHALKGITSTLGALQLSSLAKLLETAAREKNLDRICVLHPIFMEELNRYKTLLFEVFKNEQEENNFEDQEDKIEPSSIEEIVQMLYMLQDVISMGDYNTAQIVLSEIVKYRYNKDIQSHISALQKKIRDFDLDATLKGIKEIINMLGENTNEESINSR